MVFRRAQLWNSQEGEHGKNFWIIKRLPSIELHKQLVKASLYSCIVLWLLDFSAEQAQENTMRYLICIFVVSITGLLGGEGKDISTRTEDVTATCTQETDYSNNITLWCNLETFKCSSEDTQLKFKIRKPSIRKSCRKRVFTVKQKKTKNFPKIIYCCQEKEQNLTSIIHATAPGTNITALQGSPQPNNTLNQTFSAEQAHHRETEHFIQITEDPKPSGQESTGEKGIQKNKTAKNIGKNEQNKNNKGSKDTRKSNDGKRSPEEGCACGVGVNRADDDDEEDDDDGDDDEDEEDSGKQRRRRSRAVNWKIIVPSVIFTLILPLGTCLLSLWLWKKMKNLQIYAATECLLPFLTRPSP
ncbi:uncharacterized protein [Hyperolius riggenbachi]|uniref:uncharacterized protein n=1 Tax=Hyperolius riggenbachi TaxID=752182 RepID=UPI0035A370BE